MTEIMMDGEPLEVGNEVYCLLNGKGKVTGLNKKLTFSIGVAFSDGHSTYAKTFKGCTNHENRTLYWQKPEIIPPPKPKKKVKVCDWFVEWVIDSQHKNFVSRVNGLSEDDVRRMYPNDLIQKIDGTEREVEK